MMKMNKKYNNLKSLKKKEDLKNYYDFIYIYNVYLKY